MATLCSLFGRKRQAYYKHNRQRISEKEIEREVLSIAATYRSMMPLLGGLKLYHMTRDILGDSLCMGRDKYLRFLRKNHLILMPRKPRHTTNSNHLYFKYPNKAKGLQIEHVNQLWVSDITYIYTSEDGFCYLHMITDAFSRYILGYVVSPTLAACYTIEALNQTIALAGGGNLCGTIHHSDRGIQYCCDDYITRLKEHSILISMTEDSNPTDNGLAERVNGIIKNEFLEPLQTPRNLQEVIPLVDNAIHLYNNVRPHMSLHMQTPASVYENK